MNGCKITIYLKETILSSDTDKLELLRRVNDAIKSLAPFTKLTMFVEKIDDWLEG